MTWKVSDVMTMDVGKHGPPGRLVTAGAVTTTPSTALASAASLMFQHRLDVLPVVDAKHRLVGIIARSQVLKVFLRSDEAIRTEVVREYLRDSELIGRGNVEADVRIGMVHLRGEVDTGRRGAHLIQMVAGVPGVVGVESHLTFSSQLETPKPAPQAKPKRERRARRILPAPDGHHVSLTARRGVPSAGQVRAGSARRPPQLLPD